MVCVDQPLMGIRGVQFFQTELKPVRRVSADANLKRFQHKWWSKVGECQVLDFEKGLR